MKCDLYKISGCSGTYVMRVFECQEITGTVNLPIPENPKTWHYVSEEETQLLLDTGFLSEHQADIIFYSGEFPSTWFLVSQINDKNCFSILPEENERLIGNFPSYFTWKRKVSLLCIVVCIILFLLIVACFFHTIYTNVIF